MYKLTIYGVYDEPVFTTDIFETLELAQAELLGVYGVELGDHLQEEEQDENGIDYYREDDEGTSINVYEKGMKATVKAYGSSDIHVQMEITKVEQYNTIIKHESGQHYMNIDGHEDYVEGLTEDELHNYIWDNQTDVYAVEIAKHIESVWNEVNNKGDE